MRIGIDFDNTIICYDQVFCQLAKAWQLVDKNFQGSKKALRDAVRKLPDGEITWQRLQGKTYGEHISKAQMFSGFKAFINRASQHKQVELFIVSHKTELGHFDENQVNLRDAARLWLCEQGVSSSQAPAIRPENIFFESTREAKLARIKTLACTHFIDDLIEVLNAADFPPECERILFQAHNEKNFLPQIKHFTNWDDITHAFFPET